MGKEENIENNLVKSVKISPFLYLKIKIFLKEDKKKKKTDESEFKGCFNPYIIHLIREDFKRRGLL